MDIRMVRAVKAQIWPAEQKNEGRPSTNPGMDHVKKMVGQWCGDWVKKKGEEEGTERAVSTWMTTAVSAETRDDPMVLCEDEDNSDSEKIKEAGRVPEVEASRTDAEMPFDGSEGVLGNGIEEGGHHEYIRKKEHLLKRVESE